MACLRSLALRASPRVGRPAVVVACRCRTAGAASGAACDATARSAAACAATDDTTIAAAAAASASVAAGAIAGGKVIGATDAVCLRGCASGAASGLRVPRDGSGFSGLRVPHDGSGFSGVCIGCILLHAPPHAIRTERCAPNTKSRAFARPVGSLDFVARILVTTAILVRSLPSRLLLVTAWRACDSSLVL